MEGVITLEQAREVLAAQPFSALLRTRLATIGAGHATLELDIRPELSQQNGFVHGGVLAYAADNTITFAAGSVLGPQVLTGGFTVNYLRPGVGELLTARASVVYAGRRQAVCRCDIEVTSAGLEPVLCATAQGTVLRAD